MGCRLDLDPALFRALGVILFLSGVLNTGTFRMIYLPEKISSPFHPWNPTSRWNPLTTGISCVLFTEADMYGDYSLEGIPRSLLQHLKTCGLGEGSINGDNYIKLVSETSHSRWMAFH